MSAALETAIGRADLRDLIADHCPDAALCRRWSADDGGTFCRLCWRDFTDPKPLRIAEGRA